ncbi:hypothetical protein TNCV_1493161 [Trichonephila clavipes]|nr:hypothetical protein TNCV_1493161 [Trichonephila clavipes]
MESVSVRSWSRELSIQIVLVPGGRESFDRCTTVTPVVAREFGVESVSRPCKECVEKADFDPYAPRAIRVTAFERRSRRIDVLSPGGERKVVVRKWVDYGPLQESERSRGAGGV